MKTFTKYLSEVLERDWATEFMTEILFNQLKAYTKLYGHLISLQESDGAARDFIRIIKAAEDFLSIKSGAEAGEFEEDDRIFKSYFNIESLIQDVCEEAIGQRYVLEEWDSENGEVINSTTIYNMDKDYALSIYDSWEDAKYKRLIMEDSDGFMLYCVKASW